MKDWKGRKSFDMKWSTIFQINAILCSLGRAFVEGVPVFVGSGLTPGYLSLENITAILNTEAPKDFGTPLSFDQSEGLWLNFLEFEYRKSLSWNSYPFIICDTSEANSGYTRMNNILNIIAQAESNLNFPNSTSQDDGVYDIIINSVDISCWKMVFAPQVLKEIARDEYSNRNILYAPIGFPLKFMKGFYSTLSSSIRVHSESATPLTLVASKCPSSGNNVELSKNDIFSFMERDIASGVHKLQSESFFFNLVEEGSNGVLPENAFFWHNMISRGLLNESNNGCQRIIEGFQINSLLPSDQQISVDLPTADVITEDDTACIWSAVLSLALNPHLCFLEVQLPVTFLFPSTSYSYKPSSHIPSLPPVSMNSPPSSDTLSSSQIFSDVSSSPPSTEIDEIPLQMNLISSSNTIFKIPLVLTYMCIISFSHFILFR